MIIKHNIIVENVKKNLEICVEENKNHCWKWPQIIGEINYEYVKNN